MIMTGCVINQNNAFLSPAPGKHTPNGHMASNDDVDKIIISIITTQNIIPKCNLFTDVVKQ